MSLTIWCFLIGGSNVFKVNIDPTEDVSDLKDRIKDKTTPALTTVPVFQLTLYQVQVGTQGSHTKQERINYLNTLSQDLNKDDGLDEEQTISDIYGKRISGKKYYILVQKPLGQSSRSAVADHSYSLSPGADARLSLADRLSLLPITPSNHSLSSNIDVGAFRMPHTRTIIYPCAMVVDTPEHKHRGESLVLELGPSVDLMLSHL